MKALSDLRIIEYANLASGPYCSKLMADLGAEVVKIEEPEVGDESRRTGPFPRDIPHHEKSGLFLYLNTNKLGVTLNARTSTGTRIFKELIRESDILVENNPPSVMKSLGLEYEVLREINPQLIMTSITPFGQNGPYRDYKGCDLISSQMGGVGYLTPARVKDRDREPPLRMGGRQSDFMAGVMAAVVTMSAVVGRQADGLGRHLDVSVCEAVASTMARDLAVYSYDKVLFGRRSGICYVYGALTCRDGYVQVHCPEYRHWRSFLDAMGNPPWADDELFKTHQSRTNNWHLLEPLISEWSRRLTKEEIYRILQGKGVACSPVNTAEEVLNSDHLAAREFFVDVDHCEAGRLKYPGSPCKFSQTPARINLAAPLLGEHNEQIYCCRLGYAKEDLVEMRKAGVI
ncbi:MAG: CoA transferase [Dehalococcoidia bacterium]|nr:CoA transferase [Dehalococcoidia bacterium]